MIKTVDQAVQVQLRRVAAGKKGRAKAVRRFLLREYRATRNEAFAPWGDLQLLFHADFTGCKSFQGDHGGGKIMSNPAGVPPEMAAPYTGGDDDLV